MMVIVAGRDGGSGQRFQAGRRCPRPCGAWAVDLPGDVPWWVVYMGETASVGTADSLQWPLAFATILLGAGSSPASLPHVDLGSRG